MEVDNARWSPMVGQATNWETDRMYLMKPYETAACDQSIQYVLSVHTPLGSTMREQNER